MSGGERRLAAVMFTDMVGYTALTQSNESLAMEVLEKHNRLVRPILQKFRGREVKTIGDSFLVEFASALDAIRCAVDVQSYLRENNLRFKEDWKIRLRVGIHLGDIVRKNGDIFGDAVNISSRIQPMAEPEGVCITEQVYDQVQNKFELPIVSLGDRALKNVAAPIQVFKVVMPWEERAKPGRFDRLRVVVLPFINMSPNPGEEYFADGMTEELISAVSSIGELSVISRTSAMKFKGGGKTVTEIGSELKVGTLLEGSVRRLEDRVRVTAQLIDVNSDKHLWAQSYDRKIQDTFEVQTEIAQNVADALKVRLVAGEKKAIGQRQTRVPEAYSLYLQARYLWNKRTTEGLKKAIELFKKAIEIDPNYALAYSGLADTYLIPSLTDIPRMESTRRAKEAALRAFKLNNALPEVHTSLAMSLEQHDWDWNNAEKEYKKAIELNPNYSTAHHWYALHLEVQGRFDEAIREIGRAEAADPLSLIIGAAEVRILGSARMYDKAIERAKRLLELEPNFMTSHAILGYTYSAMGDYDRAVEELRIACRLDPGDLWLKTQVTCYEQKVGLKSLAQVRAALNELIELSKSQYVPPLLLSGYYEVLGEKDLMFDCFQKAFDEHDSSIAVSRIDPEFEQYRDDPRFTVLIRKMGLPPLPH